MAYSDKSRVLHSLANTIKRAGLTDRVTIIAKAKVPIIKFVTTQGRFNVDISVNQNNGITAGEVVNGFLRHLHGGSNALRSLVMITKAFLSQRSMNEVFTGGLGSYAIVCLAVSFLQMHPKIRRGEINAEQNLGVLMVEFFELYGSYFNYEEVGISIRDGGTYFSKMQRGWMDYQNRFRLSIEDPIDPCKCTLQFLRRSATDELRSERHLEGVIQLVQSQADACWGSLNHDVRRVPARWNPELAPVWKECSLTGQILRRGSEHSFGHPWRDTGGRPNGFASQPWTLTSFPKDYQSP